MYIPLISEVMNYLKFFKDPALENLLSDAVQSGYIVKVPNTANGISKATFLYVLNIKTDDMLDPSKELYINSLFKAVTNPTSDISELKQKLNKELIEGQEVISTCVKIKEEKVLDILDIIPDQYNKLPVDDQLVINEWSNAPITFMIIRGMPLAGDDFPESSEM